MRRNFALLGGLRDRSGGLGGRLAAGLRLRRLLLPRLCGFLGLRGGRGVLCLRLRLLARGRLRLGRSFAPAHGVRPCGGGPQAGRSARTVVHGGFFDRLGLFGARSSLRLLYRNLRGGGCGALRLDGVLDGRLRGVVLTAAMRGRARGATGLLRGSALPAPVRSRLPRRLAGVLGRGGFRLRVDCGLGAGRPLRLLLRLRVGRLGGRCLRAVRGVLAAAAPTLAIVAREFHRHRAAVLRDLHARELVEQLRQQVRAVAAHVEVRVAFQQTTAHLAEARGLPVVLVVGDDVHYGLLDLLLARGGRARARAGGIRTGLVAPALAAARRLAARIAQQELQRGEDIACLAKRRGRLLLAHADDGEAAFADATGQPREVAVARHDAEALHRARVQDVHGVDDHGRVGGVLALRVAELLDGRDGVFQQRVLPFGMERERPVAVDALVGDGAVLRQLVGDGLYILGRHVVGVDQERKALFR